MSRLPAVLLLVALGAGCHDEPGTGDGGASDAGMRAWTVPAPDGAPPAPHAPYPIVLVHGFGGIANLGGANTLNYFYGVADALRADGLKVYEPQLNPYDSIASRGAQLASFIDQALVDTGAAKVNIIGHSQGGLDARWVANQHPDRVAAVVMIGAPNHGSLVADIVLGLMPSPIDVVISTILGVFNIVLDVTTGLDANSRAAFDAISTDGTERFDTGYADRNGVGYFSIAGRSGGIGATTACDTNTKPAFVAKWDGYRDPLNPALSVFAAILNASAKPAPPNDGLVTVWSARWGTFLGCIPADHFDEVCAEGLPPGGDNRFDCLVFYRDLARFLATSGF